ncbi:hypothetical protein ABH945_005954 [Paraburkholderia sp. GAS333]
MSIDLQRLYVPPNDFFELCGSVVMKVSAKLRWLFASLPQSAAWSLLEWRAGYGMPRDLKPGPTAFGTGRTRL